SVPHFSRACPSRCAAWRACAPPAPRPTPQCARHRASAGLVRAASTMHESVDLAASWRRAWRGIGAADDGGALHASLISAYREPHRRYHTLQHLAECIELFDRVGALAPHAAEVEVGLWFHDAVYDVQRSDNEA